MEYDKDNGEIIIDKELNELDKFVFDFVEVLERHVGYVIVSGYVSILLGRARGSEDVDLLVPGMPLEKFRELDNDLRKNEFECANTSIVKEAFEMLDEHAIRYYKGVPVPNMEFKKISNDIHKKAFEDRLKVKIGEKVLFISPLELQIAYKLSLVAKGGIDEVSSDKDFEDAKHLYELFKEKLDKEKLLSYVRKFEVEDIWEILQK